MAMTPADLILPECQCEGSVSSFPCDYCQSQATAKLCSFKLSATHWANTVSLENILDPCDATNGKSNHCGSFGCLSPCFSASMAWTVKPDCSGVILSVDPGGGPSEMYTGEHDFNWQDEVITWVGTLGTYTLQQGAGGINRSILDHAPIYLKMRRVLNPGCDPLIIALGNEYGYGRGKPCVGNKLLCRDTFGIGLGFWYGIGWAYNILTDNIDITLYMNYPLAPPEADIHFSVGFNGGTWADTLGQVLYDVTADNGTGCVRTIQCWVVANCDDPFLPPICQPFACFPRCLVQICGDDVNASTLFLEVTSTSPDCCVPLAGITMTWDGSSYYSGKVLDEFLINCGFFELWYECSGDDFRRRLKTKDLNGNVIETTQIITDGCIGSPAEFEDEFDILSSFFTPMCGGPFNAGTIHVRAFTNNAGGP